MKSLRELTLDGLVQWLEEKGQPSFRARQAFEWLDKKFAVSFDEMSNLSKGLREELSREFTVISLAPERCMRAEDGTVKWASKLSDGSMVETVLIRSPRRNTVCISTQVGCAVRCAFCESGKHGLVRNLKPWEIVDQVVLASHEAGALVDNVVVMGSGEPMHNLDNLVKALDFLCGQDGGLGMGARHVTVSTSGIPNGIRRLADQHRPWNLALSLHAPNDRIRSMIIPDKCRFPIREVMEACEYYREGTGRMITFEYVLVEGVNASSACAMELATLARRAHAKVNLIPLNKGPADWRAPSPEDCRKFLELLESRGVQASIRLRKGDGIRAACGQLSARKGRAPIPEDRRPAQ